MARRILIAYALVLMSPMLAGAQAGQDGAALKVFTSRVDGYVQMHRRLEGPIPPLAASKDMDEVHRLMDALRARLRTERVGQGQGYLFTPEVALVFRKAIASTLTRRDLTDIIEDVEEHSPADLPPPRVNEALPEESPFISIPPRLFTKFPALPPELRYVVLGKDLLVWDHHANMVVDVAPGLFDPATYPRTSNDELR